MRIFLIGFMGSGKTTLGKQIAGLMNYKFIDVDHYIVDHHGESVSDIFANRGEDFFRKLEQSALKEIIKEDNVIVSTGGGTPCFFNNMEIMNNSGLTIYLKLEEEVIVNRLVYSKRGRPLLANLNKEELEEYVDKLMEKRCGFYNRAKIAIEGVSIRPEDIVRIIENI